MRTEFVFEWMSLEPITVPLDAQIDEARQLLADYRIQRLLVTDNRGQLVGIVTKSDLPETLSPAVKYWVGQEQLPVKAVMTPDPITINSTDTVGKAAVLMLTNKISGLPVVGPVDRQLLGIITVSDIFTMVAQRWEMWEPTETGPVDEVVPK